jgi:hypothetical protein
VNPAGLFHDVELIEQRDEATWAWDRSGAHLATRTERRTRTERSGA